MSCRSCRFFLLAILCLAPLALHAQREKLSDDDLAIVEQKWPNAIKTSTGLRYVILQAGKGDTPQPGDIVKVIFKGWFLNGKEFGEVQDLKDPFTVRIGRGLVIPAWDEALTEMKTGETRLLIVPSDLGYGDRGQLPTIPPSTTLVYKVKLLSFEREKPLDDE